MRLTSEELARRIDHTLVKPTASKDEIRRLCDEAERYNFRGVSVNLSYIPIVCEILKGKGIKIGSTIGFPFGSTSIKNKVSEIKEAVRLGADEIDAVINIGYMKSGDLEYVNKEVVSIVEMAKSFGEITVKIIIETCYLTDEEKLEIAKIVKGARADYIKTSTGFGTGGAKVEDIMLLRRAIGNGIGIKAAGGIRTYEEAIKMLEAGADIIGSSNSVEIITRG